MLNRPFAHGLLMTAAATVSGCVLVGEEPTEFGGAEELIPAEEIARLAIGARDLRQRVDFLDGAAGGERGGGRTVAWLADQLRVAGFEPAGEHGGYLQYPDVAGDNVTPTILATLPGSDPRRSGEYVMITARLEVGDTVRGAPSAAALLEVANAFGALAHPPPRPVLVLVFTGHGNGAPGEAWFAENPTVVLAAGSVGVRLDLPRAPGNAKITVGSRLRPLAERVAGELGVDVAYAEQPAPGPTSGEALDALGSPHVTVSAERVTDDDESGLDAAGVTHLARLAFLLAHGLADGPDAPGAPGMADGPGARP